MSRNSRDGGIALKNERFPSVWAAERFLLADEPASYRFIPAPGGGFYLCVIG